MDSEKVKNPFLLCWKKWKKSLAQERKMIEYRLLYKFLFGERLHMNAILNLICNLIDIFARFLSRRRSSSCRNLSKNVVFWPPSSKKTPLRRWRLSIFYGFCHLPSLQNLLEQRTGWKCSATCQVGVEHVDFWGGSGWSGCRNFPDPPECGGWWPGLIQQVAGLGRLPSSGFGCLKLAVPSRNLSPRYLTSF